MQVTDAMVAAAAESDAAFDGRTWLAMPKSERERYMERSRRSLTAALAEMWRPIEEAPDNDVVLVCGFAADGYYVADAKKIDGEWMLFSCENDDFSMESSGHTDFMPLPSPPRRK